jgi:hypothetical protein
METTMPKGFDLRCGAGKTARVWLQGKGGGFKPGQGFVLLPPKEGEDDNLLNDYPITQPNKLLISYFARHSCRDHFLMRFAEQLVVGFGRSGFILCGEFAIVSRVVL